MGRHHSPGLVAEDAAPRGRNLLRAFLALALVVIGVAAVVRAVTSGAAGGCDSATEYTVMTDQALAPMLRAQADRAADSCHTYAVETVPDQDTAARLGSGGAIADLWLASSQARVPVVAQQLGRELPSTVVASSPIVVAGAVAQRPDTFGAVFASTDLRALPRNYAFADAPLVAGVAEAGLPGADEGALTSALTRYAQTAPPSGDDPVRAAATSNGQVVVPELAYLIAKRAGADVSARVPAQGTTLLQFPLAVTAVGGREAGAHRAGEDLAQAFEADGAGLTEAGVRAADGKLGPEGGVGTVTLLPEPDPAKLMLASQAYLALAMPLKTLVVVDISGSMGEPAGGSTRIQMTADGFDKVIGRIGGNNQVGLWAFSLSDTGQHWVQLAPTRALDDAGQRAELIKAAHSLPGRVGGGTGLYDTALAAYERAIEDFDPAYSNSVILLSDGADKDPDGMSLPELVARIKKATDPSRPVTINTVGIGKDADLSALKAIADSTGGAAQAAENERALMADFVTAVARRAGK